MSKTYRLSNVVKGVRKHFVLNRELDNAVCEYAKKLGWSQARVMESLMLVGIKRFEEINGFSFTENKYGENREQGIQLLTQKLNEKYSLLVAEKRANASKRANEISDAYSKRVAYGSEGWEEG
jgi:hypothetical protein